MESKHWKEGKWRLESKHRKVGIGMLGLVIEGLNVKIEKWGLESKDWIVGIGM